MLTVRIFKVLDIVCCVCVWGGGGYADWGCSGSCMRYGPACDAVTLLLMHSLFIFRQEAAGATTFLLMLLVHLGAFGE